VARGKARAARRPAARAVVHATPANFRKLLTRQLKKLAAAGKLTRVKNSFKLAAAGRELAVGDFFSFFLIFQKYICMWDCMDWIYLVNNSLDDLWNL